MAPSTAASLRPAWAQSARQLIQPRSRQSVTAPTSRSRRSGHVRAALLDPPDFDASKLEVIRLDDTSGGVHGATEFNGASTSSSTSSSTADPGSHSSGNSSETIRRRYTLTHNDITGVLTLSVGSRYNKQQLTGFWARVLRDEVLAELVAVDGAYRLNVYCHVSGEAKWLAPAGLRSFIFLREMTLVLECVSYADRELFASDPVFEEARIYVNLESDLEPLNKTIEWGTLGDKRTWKRRRNDAKRSIVDSLFSTDIDDFADDYDGGIVYESAATSNVEFVSLNSKE